MFIHVRPLPVATKASLSFPSSRHRGAVDLFLPWFTLTLASLASLALASPTLAESANPTNEEQYLLQGLNHALTEPAGEGQRPAAWLRDTLIGWMIVRQYGTPPDQVAADFAALPIVPPPACDASLLAAARRHSDDLVAHNGVASCSYPAAGLSNAILLGWLGFAACHATTSGYFRRQPGCTGWLFACLLLSNLFKTLALSS